jgi:formamidopyrimidine-DNA glycosylase
MPELPEIETIARGLAKRVTGDVVESLWIGRKKEPLKSFAADMALILEQSRIAEVHRMGKHIVFELDRPAAPSGNSNGRKSNSAPKLNGSCIGV